MDVPFTLLGWFFYPAMNWINGVKKIPYCIALRSQVFLLLSSSFETDLLLLLLLDFLLFDGLRFWLSLVQAGIFFCWSCLPGCDESLLRIRLRCIQP